MLLGVQTRGDQHIHHGPRELGTIKDNGILHIRGGAGWGDVEQTIGTYRFDHARMVHMPRIQDHGFKMLFNAWRAHKYWTNGGHDFIPQAARANARWVKAMVEQFPCIDAIEVGNEPNGDKRFFAENYRDRRPRALAVARLMEAMREELPDMTIALGGVHSMASGFFQMMGDAIELADALSVHPYTSDPMHFTDAMARFRDQVSWGGEVWITEIGSNQVKPGFIRNWLAAAKAARVARFYAYTWSDRRNEYALFDMANKTLLPAGQEFTERNWTTADVTEIEPGIFEVDGEEVETHDHRGALYHYRRDMLSDRGTFHSGNKPWQIMPGQDIDGASWFPHWRLHQDRPAPRLERGATVGVSNSSPIELRVPLYGEEVDRVVLNDGFDSPVWSVEDDTLVVKIGTTIGRELDLQAYAKEEPVNVLSVDGLKGWHPFKLGAGSHYIDLDSPDVEYQLHCFAADHVTININENSPRAVILGFGDDDAVMWPEGMEPKRLGRNDVAFDTSRARVIFRNVPFERFEVL